MLPEPPGVVVEPPLMNAERPPAMTAVAVLGASNVSRGLSRLVATLAARPGGPADLFVAAGHGRSYGANSRVWMRRLPSILGCGLWRGLDRQGFGADTRRPGTLHALVTDVGNDLLYGFPVDQVAGWVREGVSRLAARGATIAITRLPLESIDRVGAVRYRLLRTLYVPGCPLSLEELKQAATRLDAALVGIARDAGVAIIDQPGEWYALDAIHVRRRRLDELWGRACDAWGLAAAASAPRASVARWATVGSQTAEVRSLAGAMLFTPQPVLRPPGGPRLFLY